MAMIKATGMLVRRMMLRMPMVWRTIAAVAVAGMLIAVGAIPAQAARAAYSVSISTSNKGGPYFGYTLVFYKAGKYAIATISGTVTGAVSGDVAALLAKPFGAKTFASTGKKVTLSTTGTAHYSFTDTPSLATKFEVQVSTSGQVDATSAARTVYVTPGGYANDEKTHCFRGHCATSWKDYTLLPASGYKTESGKRWHFYFALLSQEPLYLYRYKDATASRARKVNAGEFEITFTFRYLSHLRNPAPDVWAQGCIKDTERKDGIGLPRSTGCGGKKIYTYSYAG
jgi:hypothetical protein